jgi:Iap family predicted aminopeptidase
MKFLLKLYWFLFILLFNLICKSQTNLCIDDTSYILNDLNHIIYTISDDSMGGRAACSIYEIKSINFLVNEILKFLPNNYEIIIDEFTYNSYDGTIKAHNISVLPKNNKIPIYIICAHYDHLHPGSYYSREIKNKNQIHPGADDNASGVSLAIELFKILLSDKSIDTMYPAPALILLSGHETGMHGSEEWICKYKTFYNIDFALNFDMVGRMDDNESILLIRQATNDEVLNKYFFKTYKNNAKKFNINIKYTDEGFRQTDGYNFYINKIQSCTISTGVHSDYHRASDTPDKINIVSMYQIMLSLYNLMKRAE